MTSLEKRYRGILIEIPKQIKTKKMINKAKKCQITGCNKKAVKWTNELTSYNYQMGYCFGHYLRLPISKQLLTNKNV